MNKFFPGFDIPGKLHEDQGGTLNANCFSRSMNIIGKFSPNSGGLVVLSFIERYWDQCCPLHLIAYRTKFRGSRLCVVGGS